MGKILLVMLLLLEITLVAKVYKYTDRYGSTHFVDDPAKIPQDRLRVAKATNQKFLPITNTNFKDVNVMRKRLLKKGVYYKQLEDQQKLLVKWAQLFITAGEQNYDIYMKQLDSIDLKKYRTKRKRRRLARTFANYFRLFENHWPRAYKNLNFRSAGDPALDQLRKMYKQSPTTRSNLDIRVQLLEKWSQRLLKDIKVNHAMVKVQMAKLNELYDVPSPDMIQLSKQITQMVDLFEKEFNR